MDPISHLKDLFLKFPGIGPRQAERFVYYLLHTNHSYKNELAKAIAELKNNTKKCTNCERLFVSSNSPDLCNICKDISRDKQFLLIVEKETDIDKIEAGNIYTGLYFISMGTVSPLNDSDRHQRFLQRIKGKIDSSDKLKEIILAFSATFDGEYTANFLKEELKELCDKRNIKISMLGRGLSTGSEIEYADPDTLRYAIQNRS